MFVVYFNIFDDSQRLSYKDNMEVIIVAYVVFDFACVLLLCKQLWSLVEGSS